MRRKEERSKQGQTNKAKQHNTPKAVTFPKKNELPRAGFQPMTLFTLLVHIPTCHTDYICVVFAIPQCLVLLNEVDQRHGHVELVWVGVGA